ncbi:hypothetical protein ABIE38_001455 [Dietzia sp. 2505]
MLLHIVLLSPAPGKGFRSATVAGAVESRARRHSGPGGVVVVTRSAPAQPRGDNEGMSTFRLRTPDRTLDLGEFDNAQEALEHAVTLQPDARPVNGDLQVLVGDEWHEVATEGDIS